MASLLGMGTGLAVWAGNAAMRGGALRKARRENDAARGIVRYGEVPATDLLVGASHALVLGADREVRDAALAGFALESASRGVSVVVVSEGGRSIEAALAGAGCPGVALLDASRPSYEPLAGLEPDAASELLARALSLLPDAPPEGGAYLDALVRVLGRKGLPPFVRLLEECPHNRMHEVIDRLELAGSVDAAEAADLRSSLDVPPACRSFVQGLFRDVVAEGALLADPRAVPASATTSILGRALARTPGTLVLDVGSGQARSLLSLVFAEVGLCLRRLAPVAVVVCARTIAGWESFGRALRGAGQAGWVVATDEALEFFSSEEELRRWVASSDRMLCFSQGHASAELTSPVFGEYDKVDVSFTRSGGGGFGTFGINFSNGRSATRSIKRERVVKPEELRSLARDEFFVLEDGQPGAGTGIAKR